MRVRERVGDLHERAYEAHERPLRAQPGAREDVLEAPALDDAHRVVRLAVREGADLVHGDDVRVLQPRGHPRLVEEAVDDVRRRGVVLERLERDDAADQPVDRAHHAADAAGAELLHHRVARLAPDGEGRGRGRRRAPPRRSAPPSGGRGVGPSSSPAGEPGRERDPDGDHRVLPRADLGLFARRVRRVRGEQRLDLRLRHGAVEQRVDAPVLAARPARPELQGHRHGNEATRDAVREHVAGAARLGERAARARLRRRHGALPGRSSHRIATRRSSGPRDAPAGGARRDPCGARLGGVLGAWTQPEAKRAALSGSPAHTRRPRLPASHVGRAPRGGGPPGGPCGRGRPHGRSSPPASSAPVAPAAASTR